MRAAIVERELDIEQRDSSIGRQRMLITAVIQAVSRVLSASNDLWRRLGVSMAASYFEVPA